MRSALHDPTAVDHDDLVGVLGGGQAVGDGDRRAAPHQSLQRQPDPHLERGVDGRGRLVEHEQVGVGELGSQQGDQLPLPRRQGLAALADPGPEPARQGRQPVGEAERVDGGQQLGLGRAEPAVAQVLGQGVVEQEALLRAPAPRCAAASPGRSCAGRRRRGRTWPAVGSISRVSSLANVDLPEPVSPTIARRVPAAISRSTSRRTERPAGVGEVDVLEPDVDRAPRAAPAPSGPGSTRSAGVSRMPITRRQPAMAFWASVRIWVPICTGPTNSVTRNANASTSPEVMSPANPSSTPTTITPALASPAETPPSENEKAVNPWARVDGRLVLVDRGVDAGLGAVLDGVGPHHRGADDRLGDRRQHHADLPPDRAVGGGQLRWK